MVSSVIDQDLLPEAPTDIQTEALRVIESFDYFCDNYAYIHDKKTANPLQFDRYDCQRRMSDLLSAGKWPVCLKARQLGMTWLCAVYTMWKLLTVRGFDACVLQQNRDYAKDFLKRVKFIYSHLPEWLRVSISGDSRYEISFDHGFGYESTLRVIVGNETAGRSITGDLMIFDEHAYIPSAKEARTGCEPALVQSNGQVVCLSTSAGPQGDYHDVWNGAPNNKYTRVFFSWEEHPDRDQAWYDTEKACHEGDPLYMGREFPSTPEEAFAHAEGRCYPSFSQQRNVQTFEQIGFLKETADLFRAIDFGNVHPYVCLWIAHYEKADTAITVDPECVETIREFLCYRFDQKFAHGKERPKKVDDHAMDALRYLIIQAQLSGHVHIYREMYVEDSVKKGRTDLTDVDDIHRLSGWVLADEDEKVTYKPGRNAEHFMMTVCDPSQQKTIQCYSLNDLPSIPYTKPKGMMAGTQVLDGIRRINLMVEGTRTIFKHVVENPDKRRARNLSSLDVAAMREIERDPRKRRRLKMRSKSIIRRYRYM